MTLRMKYPSLNQFIENNFATADDSEEVVNKTFKVIADCMDTIYTEEDAWDVNDYINATNGKKVPEGFSYNSGSNDNWETVESLREKIKTYVDSNFEV